MRAVLLVPRRADKGHRDVLWAWCRARWQEQLPDVPIYEGHHDEGPFNRSKAINTAAKAAGAWDVAVIIDGDVFCEITQVADAVAIASGDQKVVWAHRRWRGISEADTKRLIKDPDTFGPSPRRARDMDIIVEKTTPISWSCCVAVPRSIWDDMGGFDERFEGWGFEDGAWSALVRGKYPWTYVPGDIYHWWHPRSDERIVLGLSGSTATNEYVRNALLGRRYMVAAIRDHHVGDQPGEEKLSDEMVAVHVRNLKTDDARFLAMARHRRMPEADWAEWWPTLGELQAGAASSVALRRSGVTLAVHTDGRREYIARAIPSLLGNVTGTIQKRVIFDDSGDAGYKAWLNEQFGREGPLGEQGFYIVGPETRLGYTGSMKAMWEYLGKRCSTEYVFQVEDDFIYDRPVDLVPMVETLEDNPHLRQIALLRRAYYPRELEAGGIIQEHPDDYVLQNGRAYPFLEHRLYFTANPSLFRRSLTLTNPWPSGQSSERLYTDLLNRDPDSRFAYWGSGEEWITHIGAERAGKGY